MLEIGTEVRISGEILMRFNRKYPECDTVFVPEMYKFRDKTGYISEISKSATGIDCKITADNKQFWWPAVWLIPIVKVKKYHSKPKRISKGNFLPF